MLKNDIEVLNLIYQHYKKIGNKKQEIKYLEKSQIWVIMKLKMNLKELD